MQCSWSIRLKTRTISHENPCFIIAEAGSNWKCGSYEEDLNQSKNLIKYAAKAGADAVKFQIYRPETTYVSNPGGSKSLSYSENIDTILLKSKENPRKVLKTGGNQYYNLLNAL